VLVRSKVWVAKGENRIFTTVPSIRFNLHACGSLAESACITMKYEGLTDTSETIAKARQCDSCEGGADGAAGRSLA
jgi:hypothetical protein